MSSESWTRQQELHPLEYFPQLVTGGSAVCPAVKRLCVLSKRESQKEEKNFIPQVSSNLCFYYIIFYAPPNGLFMQDLFQVLQHIFRMKVLFPLQFLRSLKC